MAGRLKRATATENFVRQPRVELFEITCLCGQTISGQRLARPQAIECPDCGEGLFALPLDPYPAVVSHPSRRAGRHYAGPAHDRGSVPSRLWSLLSAPAFPAIASGRFLLLAILATMTAGVSLAFWIDAQTRAEQTSRTEPSHPAHAGSNRNAAAPARPYRGRVVDGAVVIEGDADLPEGARLSIHVIPGQRDDRAD
jgi:hypothetical protein